MTVLARVCAPASTANLGAGFDCVAVALDLWNELEVSDGGDPDPDHLAVRAYEKIAPARGKRFAFTNRIPRERGLGSSAAVIALGLLAATAIEGREATPEELLATAVELEGHADNLAAALAGGVCLTWDGAIARLAERPPAVPIAVVPDAIVSTAAARDALPATVGHEDAAFTVARAALLGASIVAGSRELFRAALADRLHEPYRTQAAPLLDRVRGSLPDGALGATLSGSGPSVIVWAEPDAADGCEKALQSAYPDVNILRLDVSPKGAHTL
jgi:homoserine kinase